ncbi:MAG: DUF4956 domain-containing protein [Clostridia bacterium]|nr:DUF4956 domain-containing protein [Clostridia bacterium]
MENIFKGLFDSETASVIEVSDFLLCVSASLIIGIILAFCYIFRQRYTKSFVITLATLPAVVCVVIMMVNGNVGAGVAVAGAFSLVRFRSVPGSARDIGMLFLAMGAGLITGMGYIAYAFLFAIVLGAVFLAYSQIGTSLGGSTRHKTVRITVPEDLDYQGAFEEILKAYTDRYELVGVKTSNMGSLFKLTYNVSFLKPCEEKEFIDKIRERNGNLEVSVSLRDNTASEL